MCVPCILPVRSGRTPAESEPCGAPDCPALKGSAALAEAAALRPSGADWRGLYGTVPGDTHTDMIIIGSRRFIGDT